MRFGSVCSGIEAASAAFGPLGWEAAWFSEIEPFPCSLLAHHYPKVPNLGDMTTIRERIDAGEVEAPDVLCGGTPCQGFSVAGLRGSLNDDRSNLALEFIRIADAIDRVRHARGKSPAWVLFENVPGIFSTRDNAFGCFLGGLCGGDSAIDAPADGWPGAGVVAGPGRVVAWRTLDAQFFGVAQRRRRVFVLALGGAGGWACADALLPIIDRLQGHPAPRREAGKRVAGGADDGVVGSLCADAHPGAYSGQDAYTGRLIAHSLRGEGFDASEDGTGRGTPLVPVAFGWQNSSSQGDSVSEHVTPTLDKSKAPAIAFNMHKSGNEASSLGISEERTDCLRASEKSPFATLSAGAMMVRRLLPVECEKLQGFLPGYTAVPHRGKPAADGPRYKALGNSWAVPCAAWIGRRIEAVEAIQAERKAAA